MFDIILFAPVFLTALIYFFFYLLTKRNILGLIGILIIVLFFWENSKLPEYYDPVLPHRRADHRKEKKTDREGGEGRVE